MFVRFVVFRFFKPPRLVDRFLAVFAVRLSVFERVDFRFVPMRDDRVSAESTSPPITDPAVVTCSVEKLNFMFCLRELGDFLVPRRLVDPVFGVDVFEVVPCDKLFLDITFLAVLEGWELRLPRLRVSVSWAAVSVAVQSFSTSCDETTR